MKEIIMLLTCAVFAGNLASGHLAYGEMRKESYTLSEAVQYALENNPRLAALQMDIEIEDYSIDEAKGGRFPRVDFIGNTIRSRYDRPVLPITGSPMEGGFPEFDNPTYEVGVSFNFPVYMGGRLKRQVRIAEISKSIVEDVFALGRQELVFNVTSIYYKILELEKILEASENRVSQLEVHKKDVELFLKAGNVPLVDLLNTETELSHARHSALLVKHNIESAYELLKNFMGIEDMDAEISVVPEIINSTYFDITESREKAFSCRPDYKAVLKKQRMAAERVRLLSGKRHPFVSLHGKYTENAGSNLDFREDWYVSLRLTIPVFDGGVINTQVKKARKEAEKIKEKERALRLKILREIKDAHLGIENARVRMEVLSKGIETAEEILRIERLKYKVGAGTNTDALDAQTALLRARVEYYQGIYDKDIAIAALDKAIGMDGNKEGSK